MTLLKTVIVAGFFLTIFLAEKLPFITLRVMPKIVSRQYLRRMLRNALFYGSSALVYPLVLVITLYAAMHDFGWRPVAWRGGWFIIADILLLDLMIFWWHRLNHIVPFLWRFHEIHHLDEWMDSTTALRFHFGEVLLSALNRAVFIMILGIPILSVVVVETLLLLAALFHHANLRLPDKLDRALSWLIVTPRIHNIHHHAKQADTDSNYGTIFSFWDRIFASANRRALPRNMTVGVEGLADENFLRLLIRPFLFAYRAPKRK